MGYMQAAMALLANHQKVSRSFHAIANGVQSTTTSSDPAVAALIQAHVAQMRAALARCAAAPGGGCGAGAAPVRPRDPLFAAVFANARDLSLQVRGGSSHALHHPSTSACSLFLLCLRLIAHDPRSQTGSFVTNPQVPSTKSVTPQNPNLNTLDHRPQIRRRKPAPPWAWPPWRPGRPRSPPNSPWPTPPSWTTL
jgi:hypothetical protein